ncbi:protein kinase [Gordonia sp. TBRC 11910]|uniref:non-specific serine/threonine protein kinase n=1 Tax=Gordonia asplenii TaxID=2725283 RepID=A0A848KSA6_9ACTN|nr:serine/threonine-protein kinase [Gordonia asplenii]NMN99754.1 protein kinase [Gordonia asplenii]
MINGDVFAGYRILEPIRPHSGAASYLVQRPGSALTEELIVFSPQLCASRSFVATAVRNAEALAATAHPNIAAVHAWGENSGQLWRCTEHIDAGADRLVLSPRSIPLGRAIEIVAAVGAGLDHAWRTRGIVHLRVHPMFVRAVFDEDGGLRTVKLAGFGPEGSTWLDETTMPWHAAAFASPEICNGGVVDNRADIYSLGCTAFHLLTGQPPYPGLSFAEVADGHLHRPPPSAWRRAMHLPPAMDGVFARVLAKDPNDRYQSCGEFADALLVAADAGRDQAGTGQRRTGRSPNRGSGYFVVTFGDTEVGRYETAEQAVAVAKSLIDTEFGAAASDAERPDDTDRSVPRVPTVSWQRAPERLPFDGQAYWIAQAYRRDADERARSVSDGPSIPVRPSDSAPPPPALVYGGPPVWLDDDPPPSLTVYGGPPVWRGDEPPSPRPVYGGPPVFNRDSAPRRRWFSRRDRR